MAATAVVHRRSLASSDRRGARRQPLWRIRPLALACAMASAGAADLRVPVPIAMPGSAGTVVRGKTYHWQPAGQGSTLNTTDPAHLKIVQGAKRAIYNWRSFDIGTDAAVTFEMGGGAGSSALNRVVGSVRPSEIFGKLSANGEVFLINPNGILFGKNAQVNVQGLIASTLDIGDQAYLDGLNVNSQTAAFTWADDELTYGHDHNYVKVDAGAEIKTPSGGRVILLARQVENAGTISTEGGQTALVAGEKVWLKTPDKEALYASEVNDKIPALRGLLFEVQGGEGSQASNLGQILTERGNTTLVGYAVRNAGRIRATTSVTENGSVMLLARSGAVFSSESQTMRSTQGGKLTLAEGSRIEIDAHAGSQGDSNSAFTRSRIELSGQTVDIGRDSVIKAPGAVVNIRAEDSPLYDPVATAYGNQAPSTTARVVMREGAVIDVSGTRDTEVSVGRHFVTTQLLGAADLKDAPLQKDGALYRSKVTFDVREKSEVLGDTSSYAKGIQKTAGERLASGGAVTMASTGAVVTHQNSTVNISGGQVTYTEATVSPTLLKGADGKTYTLNTARKDVKITAVAGQQAPDTTRFGQVGSPTTGMQGRREAGYVEGQDAGSFQVVAPTTVVLNSVQASTVTGERQRAGKDALAKQAAVRLGLLNGSVASNVLQGLTVTREVAPLASTFWSGDALTNGIEGGSRIAASTLNAAQPGSLSIGTDGPLTIEDGAHLVLGDRAKLTLEARGAGGITLGGDITGQGAVVEVKTVSDGASVGAITLQAGRQIDVAGRFVNQWRDGGRGALAGGSVKLSSGGGLDLQDGSRIDVSGGATVTGASSIVGTRAGNITLEANNEPVVSGFAPVHLGGATLRGQAMAVTAKASNDAGDDATGKLSIKVGDVRIVADQGQPAVQQGSDPDGVVLSTAFFNQGGFHQFDVNGVRQLEVASGAVIAPRAQQWVARATTAWQRSGQAMADVMETVTLGEGLRPATSLTLRSSGYRQNGAQRDPSLLNGRLSLQAGSQILADARSRITLQGHTDLLMHGAIRAAGGTVKATFTSSDDASAAEVGGYRGVFEIGPQAVIDVSGKTLWAPDSSRLRRGEVLDGGRIELSVAGGLRTTLDIAEGAQLLANGAVDVLDVPRPLGGAGAATVRQSVASQGGTVQVTVGEGGAVLAGTLQAKAGGPQALGGTFDLTVAEALMPELREGEPEAVIRLQQSAVRPSVQDAGVTTVSAQSLMDGGFDTVRLTAQGAVNNARIETDGDVNLSVRNTLVLNAPTLGSRPASDGKPAQVKLTAGSRLLLANAAQGHAAASAAGQALWTLSADFIGMGGQQATDGIGQLNLKALSELRAFAMAAGAEGRLTTQADVNISTPQFTVATGTKHTLDASGRSVVIGGGDKNAAKPLSVGGQLTIQAATIDQQGVIRAPFGQINLQGSERVTLAPGSETSVSGVGVSVPYGVTTGGGEKWLVNGEEITALPERAVTLQSDGGLVSLASGATVDLAGGGKVLGWEFVAGPGGSTDVFTGTWDGGKTGAFAIVPSVKGHSPFDLEISGDPLAAGAARQITIGPGGPVPAGTYTVLPARYALLEGGFLVRPTAAAPLALGHSQAQTDGSSLVGAVVSIRGAGDQQAMPATFQVLPRAVAQRYSEIRETNADEFFRQQAAQKGLQAPRGTRDGGTLNLLATRLSLQSQVKFDPQAQGLGGELNISSNRIRLADGPGTEEGVLSLTVDQLNAIGASSIMLGGVRRGQTATGERAGEVLASEVIVDTAGKTLSGGDLVLAARDRVELVGDSHLVMADGRVPVQDLAVSGDGALVRVTASDAVQTVRLSTDGDAIVRERGELVVGAGVRIKGGAVTAEATRRTDIDSSATLDTKALTLGASRIAAGDGAHEVADEQTLVVSPGLTQRLAQVDKVTLRSFGGIDLAGNATLGGDGQKALTLDTSAIRLHASSTGQQTQASVAAGSVTLVNTSGLSAEAQGGGGQLTVRATGQQGGNGHVTLAGGDVAISGAQHTRLQAAGSLVVHSKRQATLGSDGSTVVGSQAMSTQLLVGGDLTVQARSVTTGHGHNGQVVAQGAVRIDQAQPGAGAAAAGGVGGRLFIQGNTITQAGTVDMASGALTLKAQGLEGGEGITFAEGSRTLLAGHKRVMDGKTVGTMGGDLLAHTATGNLQVRQGAVIDVSAPEGVAGAGAGTITLQAPQGQVTVDGTLLGRAGAGQKGGSLSIDSRGAVDLAALSDRIAAQSTNTVRNLSAQWQIRQREGDMHVQAGTVLRAEAIELANDGGALTVHGTLDARAAQGGRIVLAARDDVVVGQAEGAAQGAELMASATGSGAAGGDIDLSTRDGVLRLQDGAVLTNQGQAQGGRVMLRAGRTADNRDVKIDPLQADIQGARQVVVEGVKVYEGVSDVNAAFINKVNADNAAFMGADGAQARAIAARLTSVQPSLASTLTVRPGVEARSAGDMKLTGVASHDGWNLMHSGTGAPLARVAPMTLTLRAEGDLLIQRSLSDGIKALTGTAATIKPEGLIQPVDGASFRLVGGADAGAAHVMATRDGAGDVVIGAAGKDVVVRTTTGDIDVAAGGNIELLNERATVYTTGRPADETMYSGITLSAGNYLIGGTTVRQGQVPFLTGGGAVRLSAQGDLVAQPATVQDSTQWWWRDGSLDATSSTPLLWFSRYDKFRHGFATFGGGDVLANVGGDLFNVGLSAATSGFVDKNSDATRVFGGGRVNLAVKGDIVGGFVHAGGASADIRAGGDIKADTRWQALQYHFQNTVTSITARQDLTMGRISEVGMVTPIDGARQNFFIAGLAPAARLSLMSEGGNITLTSRRNDPGSDGSSYPLLSVFPSDAFIAAPQGGVRINLLQQLPEQGADLSVLARDDLSIASLVVAAKGPGGSRPLEVSREAVGSLTGDLFNTERVAPSIEVATRRDPVQLVSETGSVYLGTEGARLDGDTVLDGARVANPVRITAAQDVEIRNLQVQHQASNELSTIRAGRDVGVDFGGGGTGIAAVMIQGPGDLVTTAGRTIRIDSPNGVGATGSRNNTLLPEQSARLTLLAGVDLQGADYSQAQATYFHVLGAAGLASWSSDLWAQLQALDAGQALPPLQSDQALAFAALSASEQLRLARGLVGDEAYHQALLEHARHRQRDPAITLAQALASASTLPDSDQGLLAGRLLASRWTAVVTPAQQVAQVQAMADRHDSPYRAALLSFVRSRGQSVATLPDALVAFQQLSAEERLLFTNQVLQAELLASGRAAAAQASKVAKQDAYRRGFDALETVFPASKVDSHLLMGSSQVKTLQGSGIDIFTPHGGVNVGRLTGDAQVTAADLGIVTTAGGSIGMVARDNIEVNQSRIFTVVDGDLMLWSSYGDIDAGRGAKTVVGAPPPLYVVRDGKVVVDTSGSYPGSGIAALDPDSRLDLYAPNGEINAGDAGIKAGGQLTLDAVRVVGADNIGAAVSVGLPPPPPVGNAATSLGSLGQAATSGGAQAEDDEQQKSRPKRRRVLLDLLGFGSSDTPPEGADCREGVTGRSDCVGLNGSR